MSNLRNIVPSKQAPPQGLTKITPCLRQTRLYRKTQELAPWWADQVLNRSCPSAACCAEHGLRVIYSGAAPERGGRPGSLIPHGFWCIATNARISFLGALIHSLLSTFQGMDWKVGALRTPWHSFPRTPEAFHVWTQTQVMGELAGSSKSWELGSQRNVQTYTT